MPPYAPGKSPIKIRTKDGRQLTMPWTESRNPTAAEVDAFVARNPARRPGPLAPSKPSPVQPRRRQEVDTKPLFDAFAGKAPAKPAVQVTHAQAQANRAAGAAAIRRRNRVVDETFGVPDQEVAAAPSPEAQTELRRRQKVAQQNQQKAIALTDQRTKALDKHWNDITSGRGSSYPVGTTPALQLRDGRVIPLMYTKGLGYNREAMDTSLDLRGATLTAYGADSRGSADLSSAIDMLGAAFNPRTGINSPTNVQEGQAAVAKMRGVNAGTKMIGRGVSKVYQGVGGEVSEILSPGSRNAIKAAILKQGGSAKEAEEALRVFDENFGQIASAVVTGVGQAAGSGLAGSHSDAILKLAGVIDSTDLVAGLSPGLLQLGDSGIPEEERKRLLEGMLNPLIVAPMALGHAGRAIGGVAKGARAAGDVVSGLAETAGEHLTTAGKFIEPVTTPVRRRVRQVTEPVGNAINAGVKGAANVATKITDPIAGKAADVIEGTALRKASRGAKLRESLNVDLRKGAPAKRVETAPAAVETPKAKEATTTPGRRTKISTPGREWADASVRAMSLDDLNPSHLPDGSPNPKFDRGNVSQNRDRTSKAQVDRIRQRAANPDYDELLFESSVVDRGIPTVTDDGHGVAGHGRLATLKMMREEFPENWAEYQRRLKEAYPEFKDVKDPVLVNVLKDGSPENVARIGRTSNQSAADAMSRVEQSRIDADGLPENVHDRFQMEGAKSLEEAAGNPKNQTIVEHWIQGLPENERAAARNRDGAGISIDYQGRFARAMLMRVLGKDADKVLSRYMVDGEGPKRVMNGLEQAAGSLLEMEGAIKRGEAGELGQALKTSLARALDLLNEARDSKNFKKTSDWFDQSTMAGDDYAARKIGKAFSEATSQHQVSEIIERLAGNTKTASGGMFGDEIAFKNIDELVDSALPDVQVARGEGVMASKSPKQAITEDGELGLNVPNDGVTTRTMPAPLPKPAGYRLRSTRRILIDLSREFKKYVAQGRTKRGTLGTYSPSSTRTIIRFSGDISTAAHELGHAFDDLYNIGKDLPEGKIQQELLQIFENFGRSGYKPEHKIPEGIAEYIRAYLINPDEARTLAPEFTKRFESMVPDHVLAKVSKMSDQVRIWSGLSDTEQTRAQLSRPERVTPVSKVRNWLGKEPDDLFEVSGWSRLKKFILDDQAPLEEAVNIIKARLGLVDVDPLRDPLGAAADMRYSQGKVDSFLENGVRGANGKRITKPLKSIIEPLVGATEAETRKNLEDLSAYMISQRVIEKAPQLVSDAISDVADRMRSAMEKALRANGQEQAADLLKQVGEARKLKLANHEDIRKSLTLIADAIEGDNPELAKSLRRAASFEKTGTVRRAHNRRHMLSGVGGGVYSDYEKARSVVAEVVSGEQKRRAKLDVAAAAYREFADGLLEYGLQHGRWDAEFVNEIRDRNLHYVAMQRIMDGGPGFNSRRGLTRARRLVHKFEGSTREIKDPVLSLIEQAEKTVFEVDRNAAMRSLRDLVVEGTDDKRKLYDSPFPVDFTDIMVRAEKDEPGAIKIFVKGKEERWKIQHKDLKESLDMLGHATMGDLGPLVAFMSVPARVMRGFVTTSPAFITRNLIRDTFQRRLVSSVGPEFRKAGGGDWLKGASEDEMAMMREHGGSLTKGFFDPAPRRRSKVVRDGSSFYLEDQTAYAHIQTQIIRDLVKSPGERIVTSLKDWSGIMGSMSASSEIRGRVAEFRAAHKEALAKGLTGREAELYAARKSRGLLDYMRAGTSMRALNKIIPFLNANIQGFDVEARSFRRNPAQYVGRWIKLAVAPTLAAAAWNESQGAGDEYDQLPAWQKDLFWNFKVQGFGWIRVPKPFQAGVLASGVERAYKFARAKALGDDSSAAKAFEGYSGSLISSFGVVNAQDVMGGGWAPFGEVAMNRDMFRGGTVVDPFEIEKDISLREHADKRSSNLGHIGSWLSHGKADPRQVDHIVRSYTGGWGQIGTATADYGRPERMLETSQFFNMATGLTSVDPALQARDVQWVISRAKELGLGGNPLKDQVDAYFAAEPKDRSAMAAKLRERAVELRKVIESASEGKTATEAQEAVKAAIK